MRDESTPFALAPLFVLAAALRILLDNVTEFSRADESVYLLYAQNGYPKIVRMFLDDPGMWVFPNPLRWSYLTLATLCDSHHALATLSTIAGIVTVALTFWIARFLFGATVGLVATALVAVSPLQLAFGRRALADEFFCAAVLASIAALLWCAERFSIGRAAAFVAATTIAIAAKEQLLFLYPVILGFWYLRERKLRLVTWAAPPFFFFAGYCVLARDAGSFFRIARIITGAMTAPYAAQYQSGPPHRLLLDLLAIAPLVTIAMIAALVAIGVRRETGERMQLAVLVLGILAVHAILPSQNVRYILCADPLIRILVAAAAVHALREKPLWTFVAINAAAELWLFYAIFLRGAVYDPVTDNVLRALEMLPR